MKIVVTGSNGFIGKNLLVHLKRLEGLQLETITREDKPADYKVKLKGVDIVYHLAGVNRPQNEEEFTKGNPELTFHLIKAIQENGDKPRFVLSSSTQAEKDNEYGKSKRAAEEAIEQAVQEGVLEGVIYRLPGVFGKWSRPNYNTVVATFCYNVAHGLPVEVRDPSYELPLVYIDDVMAAFIKHLDETIEPGKLKKENIKTLFKVTLGELASIIKSFPESRKSLKTPKVGDTFEKYLYSTYLSFLPENKFSYPMELKTDNRGDLFEWIKSEEFGQIFVSTTKPGITRGNHYHHTKTEKFLVIRGEGVIRFRKINSDKVIEYPVSGEKPTVVDIPIGYAHNITNTGDKEMITLFWANEIFDQQRTDTYFLEV